MTPSLSTPAPLDLTPDDMMHEREVMEKYGRLFAERELAEARREGTIEWHDLRKGPHYTNDQLMAYLQSKVKPLCQHNAPLDDKRQLPDAASGKAKGSSKSVPSGSDMRPAPTTSSVIGMTRKLEERAAAQLDCET